MLFLVYPGLDPNRGYSVNMLSGNKGVRFQCSGVSPVIGKKNQFDRKRNFGNSDGGQPCPPTSDHLVTGIWSARWPTLLNCLHEIGLEFRVVSYEDLATHLPDT